MTTAQVVETSVTVNNNRPIQDYVHPDDQTQPTLQIDHSIMLFVFHPKILRKDCLQFLLGVKMALRETENNAYAKFWGDKKRVLWYVMVFFGVVNYSWVQTFHTNLLLWRNVRSGEG